MAYTPSGSAPAKAYEPFVLQSNTFGDDPVPISDSILLMGASGSGKTKSITTLPGRKFAYLFDPLSNVQATLAGSGISYAAFPPQGLNINITPLASKSARDTIINAPEPVAYINWELDFYTRLDSGFFNDINWLLFDSLTTFQDIVMDRTLHLNGRAGKHPEQADWTASMNAVKNVLRTLTNIANVSLLCTGHIDYDKLDANNVNTTNKFVITGQNATRLPLLFQNVWRTYTEIDFTTKKLKYMVQTVPDDRNKGLRCGRSGLQMFEDITIPPEHIRKPEGYGLSRLLGYKP